VLLDLIQDSLHHKNYPLTLTFTSSVNLKRSIDSMAYHAGIIICVTNSSGINLWVYLHLSYCIEDIILLSTTSQHNSVSSTIMRICSILKKVNFILQRIELLYLSR
jgi:hypothetical protein